MQTLSHKKGIPQSLVPGLISKAIYHLGERSMAIVVPPPLLSQGFDYLRSRAPQFL